MVPGEPGTFAYGVSFLQNLAMIQGLSQAKWAKKAGIDPSYLSQLLSGKKKGPEAVWLKICGALQVDSRRVFPAPIPGVLWP